MKLKRTGRVAVIATASFFAIATMSGAFALPPVQDEFMQCLDNATGGDIESVDVAKRIGCCKQAGGSWVEIYDADGNVVDGFCDGAEEVYEPEEESSIVGQQINPAALDNLVSGSAVVVASDPTPAPAEVAAAPESGSVIENAPSDPSPAPDAQPAPEKVKRHRHHHRRHR